MQSDRDLLRQALEALEEIADEVFSPYDNKLGEVILALRERLAQPIIVSKIKEDKDIVTYDTGGFELEAGFYSARDLREMLESLDEMNAAARRFLEKNNAD